MNERFRETIAGRVRTIESFAAGADAPLVHFAHATGMCAGIYQPIFQRLAPACNLVASDARGHGRTQSAADPATLTDWRPYADDLAALLAVLPAAPRTILAGHSMGATVSMELAATLPGRIAAVVMIEPAFLPFAAAAAWRERPAANRMAEQALRRRAVWPSRAAMRGAYAGRGVFATWPDTGLDAYLAGGVRDRDDGSVELACAPAWEAATFAAVSTGLEAAVAGWRGTLTLLHAAEHSTVGADDAATVAARPDTRVIRFQGLDHFLPLQAPDAVATAILAVAR